MSDASGRVEPATDRGDSEAAVLPFWRKFGWGMGSLGIGLVLNIQAIFFVSYAVDFVGMAPALVGTLVLVAKLFDLATDLPMGVLSDRTRSPLGRRRPYILFGGILAAAVFAAMFNIPALDGLALEGWVFGVLVMMAIAYTVFSVPYIAVPSEMTDDYHERSSIMSWRVMFSMTATTAGALVAGTLIDIFGGGREGFGAMGIAIGAVIVGCTLVVFFATESHPRVGTAGFDTRPPGLMEQIKTIGSNSPFLILLGVKLMQLLSLASNFTIQVFFFINVIGVSFTTYGTLALWKGLATVASTPFWLYLSRRMGKRFTYVFATIGQALVNLSWLLADAGEPLFLSGVRFLGLGFFTSGLILMGLSMLTDTIEYDRRRTGLRREGIFSGLYTSVEKLAFALGPAIAGIYLQASGYVAGGGGAAVQPETAITAIYVLLSLVPASLSLLSVVLLAFYKLDFSRLRAAGELH